MSNKLPTISVLTPSFNQGQFIEQTILSVLNQEYPKLEYIIIDGGSTDGTIDIIKKYDKYLKYWVSDKDRGQSEAINKGYKKVTGQVVNWLNSDDYYEPGALHKVGQAFLDSSINAYCGISRSFPSTKESYSAGTDLYPGNLYKTMGYARIDQPETFFRKSCIDEIGFLNEHLHYVMDKDLWFRFLSRFGIEGVVKEQELLAHFRLHSESKTVSAQSCFLQETKCLFYTYAQIAGYQDFACLYQEVFCAESLPLTHVPTGLDSAGWNCVFHYYTMLSGLECYANNDFARARRLLAAVDVRYLSAGDALCLQQVKIKMLFPVRLKAAWNKFR